MQISEKEKKEILCDTEKAFEFFCEETRKGSQGRPAAFCILYKSIDSKGIMIVPGEVLQSASGKRELSGVLQKIGMEENLVAITFVSEAWVSSFQIKNENERRQKQLQEITTGEKMIADLPEEDREEVIVAATRFVTGDIHTILNSLKRDGDVITITREKSIDGGESSLIPPWVTSDEIGSVH